MSNVCCALCNVVVKAPDGPLTGRRPLVENDLVIRSFRQWVVLQVHRTSHNRHSTFDSFGCRQFFHSTIDRRYSVRTSTFCPKPLIALPNSSSNIISLPDVVLGCSALLFIASKRPLVP